MAYIGNSVENQGFTPAIDYFNGDGTTVTFTLSRPLVSVAQVIAVIENVPQNPSTAFTVTGNEITFTSAPPSGSNNIWVEYTSLITQYNAISQDPSVIGDITATGGFLATGDFGNTFTDGTIVDYVTGNARITTGPADGVTIYNGGPTARTALAAWDTSGNLTNAGSISSPAATALTLKSAGTTAITVDTAQNVGIGTASPTTRLSVRGIAGQAAASVSVPSTGTTVRSNNTFRIQSEASGRDVYMQFSDNVAYSTEIGMLSGAQYFCTGAAERMRIDMSGSVGIGTASLTTSRLQVYKNSPTTYNDSNIEMVSGTGDVVLAFHAGGATAVCLDHVRGGGSIRCVSLTRGAFAPLEASAFTVGSDYRLKENIAPLTGALDRVASLPVHRFNFKPASEVGMDYGNKTVDGFLAHEVAAVVPEAAFGEKDAVNEDGKPVYQSIDQAKLVPLLTAAIQEQQTMIEELKTKVAALEAK